MKIENLKIEIFFGI